VSPDPFAQTETDSSAINELLKFLPPDIQAIVRNPPSLSTPSSFMPALRLVSNWGYILVVLVAFYIVWTVISGFVGTFYRFFRFWAKLAPVIGLIGWLMAQSGHGSLPEVFDLVKQWTGIGGTTAAGNQGQAPGIAQLAGMFGLGGNANANTKRSTKRTTRSSTRGKKAAEAGPGLGDLADILKSATGGGGLGTGAGAGAGLGEGGEWQDVVQGYVKNAVLKASGLDWLFGQTEKPEEKRRTR